MTGMRQRRAVQNSVLISVRWTVVRLRLPVIMKNARANIAKPDVSRDIIGMRRCRVVPASVLLPNGILKIQDNVAQILINMMNPTVRFQAIIIAIQIPAAGSMMIVR